MFPSSTIVPTVSAVIALILAGIATIPRGFALLVTSL